MSKKQKKTEPMPEKYSPKLPRVSRIVEFFFPFTGEPRERFLDWLMDKDIRYDEYMKEALDGGHYVHKALEDYISTGEFRGKKYKGIIEGGIKFIKDSSLIPLHMEHYIKTKDYQGTIDLVCEIGGEKWVVDWKTYGLWKAKFWIPPPKEYKKPYAKLKKARLQLSLYARAMKIENIAVVELTTEWYKFHKLERFTNKELDIFIREYKSGYVDEI